jgi:hypothetical protein
MYPGSFDFEVEKKSGQKTAQESRKIECAEA